ncbi:unnamed protein product, partial [Brassica rapa subsp. trilocularis]
MVIGLLWCLFDRATTNEEDPGRIHIILATIGLVYVVQHVSTYVVIRTAIKHGVCFFVGAFHLCQCHAMTLGKA